MKRESLLPLTMAFVVAALLHVAVMPLAARYWQDAGTVAAVPSADLSVDELDVPQAVRVDALLNLAWSISNRGEVAADAPWVDHVYLSRSRHVGEDGKLLVAVPREQPLRVGERHDVRVSDLAVDASWIGRAYIVVHADAGHDVDPPHRRANNKLSAPIWIEPTEPPDLTVDAVEVPQRVPRGGTMQVRFTIANIGAGIAWQRWHDRVYLSHDDQLSEDDLLLAELPRTRALMADQSYQSTTAEIQLPKAAAGQMYLIVQTNADGMVDEGEHTYNNTYARPIHFETILTPDLQVGDIRVPEIVITGQDTPISFDVINRGNMPTGDDVWLDRVVLSLDEHLSEDDEELLAVPRIAPLNPGQGYRNDQWTISLPPIDQSYAWLFVETDTDGHIDEGPYSHNNIRKIKIEVRPEGEEPQTLFGKQQPPYELTTAWISWDDFLQLQAHRGTVTQPAIQREMDPVPDAPLLADPTPGSEALSLDQLATSDRPPAERDIDIDMTDQPGEPSPVAPATGEAGDVTGDAGSPTTPPGGDVVTPQPPALRDLLPPVPVGPEGPLPRITEQGDADRGEASQPMPEDMPDPQPDDSRDTVSPLPQPQPTPPAPPLAQPRDQPADDPADAADDQPRDDGQPMPTDRRADEPADQQTDVADADAQRQTDQPDDTAGAARRDDRPQAEQDRPQRQPQQGGRPSAAPRDDRESPPVMRLVDIQDIRPGAVITGKGIEIQTAVPRFTAVARASTIPHNPRAILTFDGSGQVIKVEITRSSGADNIDGPVIASLYRWRARGDMIDQLADQVLEVPIQLILVNQPGSE